MAEQLVHNLAAEFDPEKYTDEYRANLMKLIRAKMHGKKLKAPAASADAGDDKVIDLMARLRQSLAEGKPRKAASKSRARKKKATGTTARTPARRKKTA